MMSYITKKNIPCQSCMWELKPALGVDFHAELTRHFHLKLTHPLA